MKVLEAAQAVLEQVAKLAAMQAYSGDVVERLYALRSKYVEPLGGYLEKTGHDPAAAQVKALLSAIEEYVLCYQNEPDQRAERRKKVETVKVAMRRTFFPEGATSRDQEADELLADFRRWQWRTQVDANGRIVFATPGGTAMPAKGEIAQRAGPEVIEQATKASKPYSDLVRPRDQRGDPGGLIVLREARRLVVVGDLHGRYDNLEAILKDRDNLAEVINGQAHLVFTGDAVHPPSSLYNDDRAYEDSFAVMLLIMTLKAENPEHIHYLVGNHDNAHVGGGSAARGNVQQDAAFEEFITRKFGAGVLDRYREFVAAAPLAVKARMGSAHVLLLHACLPPGVHSDADLTDILLEGRKSKAVRQILWSRKYSEAVLVRAEQELGVRLVVSGHTTPTSERVARCGLEMIAEPVFAHFRGRQIVINTQSNTFGYLDLDLTQEMPERILDLHAPDDRPAFRVFARKLPEGEEELRDDGRDSELGAEDLGAEGR